MKANKFLQNLKRRDNAVSPVIAVILMVAITVVLAATVYVWVSGFGKDQQKVVNTQITALGGEGQITLKHIAGDAIASGYWRVSITNASVNTAFCQPVGTALSSGQQVVFTTETLTADGSEACTGTSGSTTAFPNGRTLEAGEYRVVVVELTTRTVLLDRLVTVADPDA